MDDPLRHLEQLRKTRRRRVRSVGIDELIAETRRTSVERHKRLGELIDAWNELLPPDLAERAAIDGLRRGVLHVSVDSSPTGYALDRALREGLLDDLRSRFRATLVRVKISLSRGKTER